MPLRRKPAPNERFRTALPADEDWLVSRVPEAFASLWNLTGDEPGAEQAAQAPEAEEQQRDHGRRNRLRSPRPFVLLSIGAAALLCGLLLSMIIDRGGSGRVVAVDALMRQAAQASAAGDLADCIGLYTQVLDSAVSDVAALRGRSACEAQGGNSGQAATDLSRAISLDPSDPALFLSRGAVNDQLGNMGSAVSDYEHVIGMHMSTPDDNAAAVEGLRALHVGSVVTKSATQALRLFPGAWQSHDEVALADADAGDIARGFAEFQQAIALTKDGMATAKVLSDRARLEMSSGDLPPALADANEAVTLVGRWEYLRTRAEIRQAVGDLSGAETDLSRALAVEQTASWPEAGTVHIWLLDERGRLRLEMGDKLLAASDFSAALAIAPPGDAATRAILQHELSEARS